MSLIIPLTSAATSRLVVGGVDGRGVEDGGCRDCSVVIVELFIGAILSVDINA
jgi:hypothetical protein